MPQEKHVTAAINTGALLGSYLTDIQNLLDIITFTYSGRESVSPEQYEQHLGFMAVDPSLNQRLSFEEARERSADWVLTTFLTDCINATGVFLDACRTVCALYRLSHERHIEVHQLHDALGPERQRFHKLGFPDKFTLLRNEFGVHTSFEEHFLSLNRARNCLVHRRGVVSERDTNSGSQLVVRLRVMELVAAPADVGDEVLITGPTEIEGESVVSFRSRDATKSFELGAHVALDIPEMYQSVFTLYSFAADLVRSIETYGNSHGADEHGDQMTDHRCPTG